MKTKKTVTERRGRALATAEPIMPSAAVVVPGSGASTSPCPPHLPAGFLSRDEQSLLLFLETCVVDHGGLVNIVHMNGDDFGIAERWAKDGFIQFGRVASATMPPVSRTSALLHWCQLSEKAWETVRTLRRERAERLWKSRSYRTTEEWQKGTA